MNYRFLTVMPNQTFGVAGTHIQSIRTKDPISVLRFSLRTTVAGGPHINHHLAAFTKIEILDGSDVLLSISGDQMDAVHYLDTRKIGNPQVYQYQNALHVSETAIHFGRWPLDELLAFDPKKFDNPQIRITYNSALFDTTATATQIHITADCFDEKVISPIGFLQVREYQRFTPTNNAIVEVELPVDLAIRTLIVQPFQVGVQAAAMMQNVRLDEDNDKRVVFDFTEDRLQAFQFNTYPEIFQKFIAAAEGRALPFFVAPHNGCYTFCQNADVRTGEMGGDGQGGEQWVITAGNADKIYGHVGGYVPYGCYFVPMGKKDEIDDWYDVTKVGDLRLRITGGAAVGAAPVTRVVLQQLRRY